MNNTISSINKQHPEFYSVIIISLILVVSSGILIAADYWQFVLLMQVGLACFFLLINKPPLAIALYIPIFLFGSLSSFDIQGDQFGIPGINLQTVLILPMIGLVLLRIATGSDHWKRTQLDLPLFLFFIIVHVVWTLVNQGQIEWPEYERVSGLKGLIFLVLIYYVATNSKVDESWLKKYMFITIAVGVCLAIRDLTLFSQGITDISLDWRQNRLTETSGLDVVGGNTLLQGLFFGLAFSQALSSQLRITDRFFYGGASILFFIDILLSFYRSAYLMLFLIIFISILLIKGLKKSLILLPVICVLIITLAPSATIDRVLFTFQASKGMAPIESTGRIEKLWPITFEVIINNLVFGVGFQQLPIVRGDGHGAYNQYLRWLAEFGIIGFTAGLYLIYVIIKFLWQSMKQPSDKFVYCFKVGLFSSWIGILARNLTGDAFQFPWLSIFMALLGALTCQQIDAAARIRVNKGILK